MKAILMILVFVANLLYCNDDDGYIDDGYREFKNGDEALEWGNTWMRGSIFTKEEKEIILEYSKHSWIFNDKLRAGWKFKDIPLEEQEKIKKLERALSKFPIFEKILVYRYASLSVLEQMYGRENVAKMYVGGKPSPIEKIHKDGKFTEEAKKILKDIKKKIYIDRGFMSTTLIKNAVFGGRPIELVIKVPKYTTGLFIARKGFTLFIPEYEVLFQIGRTLYFEGFELSSDMKRLTLYAKMKGPWWYVVDDKKE